MRRIGHFAGMADEAIGVIAEYGNDRIVAGQWRTGAPVIGLSNVFDAAGDLKMWAGAGADVQYGGEGNDVLHALANDNQRDVLDCGPGYDVAYLIVHDPARLHGGEQVIRLSPDEAAAMATANDDNG